MASAGAQQGVALAALHSTPGASPEHHAEPKRVTAAKPARTSLGAELAARTAWPSLISAVIALAVTVAVQRAFAALFWRYARMSARSRGAARRGASDA